MDNILTRYNKSIIAIGNAAYTNRVFDFNNDVDYIKYLRLKRSKELYSRFVDNDLYLSQTEDEIKELLNKISFE